MDIRMVGVHYGMMVLLVSSLNADSPESSG